MPKRERPWSKSDVQELKASLAHGESVELAAIFLEREESDVRAKMRELGLKEKPQSG